MGYSFKGPLAYHWQEKILPDLTEYPGYINMNPTTNSDLQSQEEAIAAF